MKAAVVVDDSLPVGLIANSAAVLGITLGATHPEIVGPDVVDRSGRTHPGITGLPIPILHATQDQIVEIADKATASDALSVVGFTDVAQRCKSYDEYEKQLSVVESAALVYRAVLLVGEKRAVNKLVGSLPLVRDKNA